MQISDLHNLKTKTNKTRNMPLKNHLNCNLKGSFVKVARSQVSFVDILNKLGIKCKKNYVWVGTLPFLSSNA